MASDKVRLSIAIPTYRRAELLGDCLYSLSQLHSLPEHEILIVENDASYIEKTLEVVRRYGHLPIVLYKNESNLGMIGNWNRCIDLSKGEYLTLLNDDDLLLPNWSSVMTACLSGKEFTGCRCKGSRNLVRACCTLAPLWIPKNLCL